MVEPFKAPSRFELLQDSAQRQALSTLAFAERFRAAGPNHSGEQCIGCPEPGTWLFEFVEQTRWWQEGTFVVCDNCMTSRGGGWVYFVRAGELVKIGYTANVSKRLSALKTASPLPLELWHKEPGGACDEAALHLKFAADRERGEWFRISDSITSYVADLKAAA